MKIFISWSGTISKQVASVLKEWLPDVLHNVDPFISTDIDKGDRWGEKIAEELDSTDFGIICVTRDNISAPWLNFEAGALSKIAGSKVCTLAFGLKQGEIPYPLAQFQATEYNKEDIKKLISTINDKLGEVSENKLEKERLYKAFNRCWSELSDKLDPIYQQTKKKVIWVYEKSELTSELEIQKINKKFPVTDTKWYLDKDEKPDESDADILIYVYGKSSESQSRLEQVINFTKSLDKKVALIIYTRYASGNKRLSDLEFNKVMQCGTPKIANMEETLIARFQEVS